MTKGCLIAVVGPSGVGKDSLITGLCAANGRFRRVRRVITRDPELGGEDYDAVTPAAFDAAVSRGAFCLSWGAHDLRYGIPCQVLTDVQAGAMCLANLSRTILDRAAKVFPNLVVMQVTARADTLADRLATRGRETKDDIQRRLERVVTPLPSGLRLIKVCNDGPLDATITHALAALDRERM